ncbi:MAG: dihydropteroate synthase-like protein [Halobacteriota archaeon]
MLVATGRWAEKAVRQAVGSAADVLVLGIDVAALMTPSLLKSRFEEFTSGAYERYDLILIPGSVNPAGFGAVAKELGIQVALGPKQAYDLKLILTSLDRSLLSLANPADSIIHAKRAREARLQLAQLESAATCAYTILDLKIGGQSRMKVLGEIIDAPFVDARSIAAHHIYEGADIVDVGIPAGTTEREVRQTFANIKAVTDRYNIPTSVDSLDSELIRAGIEAGADLVLSFTAENARDIAPLIAKKRIATVVLPEDGDLCSAIRLARSCGIHKILADPILYPLGSGAVNSLVEYKHMQSLNSVPLFLGVGNVVELMEADSIGANALLAGLAMELGVAVLFTPEHSDKAKGSISELKTAAQMMQLARARKSAPKDLGIDLLVLKERRRRPEYRVKSQHTVHAKDFDPPAWEPDPAGNFVIGISEGSIFARHDSGTTVCGKSAKSILDAIFELELVSILSHASYLGSELKKAEIALKLGRSYAQDDAF